MKNLIPALFVLAFTAASAHAQSQSGANSYNVPMFAGQVGQTYASAQSDCVQCGIIADSESASFDDEGSTLPMQAGSGSGYTIYPVTQPTLAFADSRRSVQISGVAVVDGKPAMANSKPVPAATVDVIVKLDGDFVYERKIVADKRGFYATYVEAPARIASVTVTVESFCSVNGGCTIQYGWNENDSEGAIAN